MAQVKIVFLLCLFVFLVILSNFGANPLKYHGHLGNDEQPNLVSSDRGTQSCALTSIQWEQSTTSAPKNNAIPTIGDIHIHILDKERFG